MAQKNAHQQVNVEEIRKQLLAQRSEILHKAVQHQVDADEPIKGDLVDQSTDLSEREQILGLVEGDREKLRNIEAALEMMENNTYGICEMCNEPIPVKRLLAVPTARYCVPCKEKMERLGIQKAP